MENVQSKEKPIGENESEEGIGTESRSTLNMSLETVKSFVLRLKNRKAPSADEITNEFIKYGRELLLQQITLLEKIYNTGRMPKAWKSNITISIFNKSNKKIPQNYRGIILLSAMLKLMTRIITEYIGNQILISEEQQSFRAIEFNKSAYLCFVDLTQAFDRIQLKDVLNVLRENRVDTKVIKLIKEMNTENTTKIRTDCGSH
ncbi:PREDICTED: uncharacterized protein LOC106751991 [Dinoponera quadriceps]|uniref:Uncharacterized protein LOC106751991 n=1 Tax=Dinoponera quadriceps TaxID=609295 RepID=A0A6P3YCV2_DINQU|nr:PREDICTED: uncharacterized protein LOC106751991 [Dinoponera quadriceps]